jgi:hypothetical protein
MSEDLAPPQQISVKRCSSCGAEIFWAITQRGSRIPLDVQNSLGFILEGGKVDGAPLVSQKRVYQTHFATCPHAKQHRKKKTLKERMAPDGPTR